MRTRKNLAILLPKTGKSMGGIYALLVRCGKPTCRCTKTGHLHSAHYYMYRERGRLVKRHIRKANVEQAIALLTSIKRKLSRRRRLRSQSHTKLRNMRELLRGNEAAIYEQQKGGDKYVEERR